jgi:predicted Rossmann-fold nucleotide-binding protein
MEASHLGASLAKGTDSDLDNALAQLKTQLVVPGLKDIVNSKGTVDSDLVDKAHAWFKPAYEIAASISSPGESLAIPTWHYGHEPTSPFATHIAKYFQNSIREDGLLALAKQGIIYSEGKAGTIQEIFQDSTQNYYRTFDYFSPMVLLGTQYWTTTYPVVGVLKKLFTSADFGKYVLVTDDVEEAGRFIEEFSP